MRGEGEGLRFQCQATERCELGVVGAFFHERVHALWGRRTVWHPGTKTWCFLQLKSYTAPAPDPAAHLSSDPSMHRMPLDLNRSGPRVCSRLDSHALSFCMSQLPSIWMPTEVTLQVHSTQHKGHVARGKGHGCTG